MPAEGVGALSRPGVCVSGWSNVAGYLGLPAWGGGADADVASKIVISTSKSKAHSCLRHHQLATDIQAIIISDAVLPATMVGVIDVFAQAVSILSSS